MILEVSTPEDALPELGGVDDRLKRFFCLTLVVLFVVFILVWRMPFGLTQSLFSLNTEVVEVALETCSCPSSGNSNPERKRKKIVEFGISQIRFLVM